MTTSNSMPRPVAPVDGDANSRLLDRSELIDRLATEMRVKSGGELPQSFCIDQVKRQLEGTVAEPSAASIGPTSLKAAEASHRSVFHAWALGD